MRCTKFLTDLKNNYAEILFFITIFFTSCLFMDTVSLFGENRRPMFFFMDFRYVWLKTVLSVILPMLATVFYYIRKKSLIYMADTAALVMSLFSIGFILDYFTLKMMWRIEKSIVIYHLGYALITFFTVFITISAIAFLKKQGTKGYSVFCRTFFVGLVSVMTICFFTIYFLNRNFGNTTVNLIPFQGEFRVIIEQGITLLVIRDIGNICMFSASAMMIAELAKKHKIVLGTIIPILFSVAMEIFQYVAKCGDADIDDVIANTFGTILGILVYKFIIIKIKEKELCLEL